MVSITARPIHARFTGALLSTTMLASVGALSLGSAQAQTTWTGTTSTDWFTGTNWSAGVPTSSVEAIVNTANARDPLVAGGVTGKAGRVVVGNNFGQSGALDVTGALTVSENFAVGSFIVGNLGTGTVMVSAGGDLITGLTGIGNFGTGTGTVNVTGAGSTWTVTSAVDIGSSGKGTVNISAGGVVSGGATNIGNDNGATGTLSVTGTGSKFSFNSLNIGAATGGTGSVTISDNAQLSGGGAAITVGSLGKGTLLLQSGGDASGSTISIGSSATGQATVTGAGSTLTSTASTIVGVNSTGTLNVADGGVASSKRGRLGATATGNGTVTVNGTGSQWTVTEDLLVGESGTGALNVEAGAVVSANQVVMASNTGASNGTITVTGAGSQLNVTTSLQTGLATNVVGTSGKLSVLNGGVVNIGTGLINDNFFANNSTAITVDGAGSKLTIVAGGPGVSTVMRLGIAGTNSLAVGNGGAVSVDSANFQTVAGSSVAVTVADAGSTFSSNGLQLGGAGTASLKISNGGLVNTGSDGVTIESTGAGTVSIGISSGGTLTDGGFFQLRSGSLTIDSGGSFSGSILNIGTTGGPAVTATVTGAGSKLTTTGSLTVGSGGTGTLRVENGGALVTNAGNISNGSVTLTGAGSSWTASDKTTGFINMSATGSLTIEQAATMTVAGSVSVGGALVVRDAGSVLQTRITVSGGTAQILNGGAVDGRSGAIGITGAGTVTVDGVNSRWTMTGDLDVGLETTGTLNIQNSGRVAAQDIYIGCCASGVGTVNVTGSGALFEAAGTLRVGDLGNGTLNITAGGDATSAAALIAAKTGSVGKATVSGAGSTWTNTGTLAIGGAGTGTLTIADGGAVSSTGAVSINAQSTLNIGAGGVAGTLTAPSIANDGTVRFDHTGTVTFGVAISGAGGVIKDAAGTTIITADNTYTGVTTINAGTLQIGNGGTSGAIVGNVANNSVLAIDRTNIFTYAGVIGGGGAVNLNGTGTTIFTGDNTYTGLTTINAGVLRLGDGGTSGGIAGNVVNNTTLIINRSNDFSYAGIISGAGDLRQIGSGRTNLTGDSSVFTGSTSVEGGTLAVNGKLGGALDVGTAGRLQGTGTVGNTIVNGTIAPGNSIGTLNVAGNVIFAAGSVYEVEVNAAGQSDRIVATGTATIGGGSVTVLAEAGGYAPSTTYTILTAGGGRTGTFTGGVTSNLAFLDPSLGYDANNVYLTLTRNTVAFTNVGLTPNQIAAGGGVESLGAGNPIYDAVVVQSAPQARDAFDRLSGEIHPSLRATMIEGSRFVRNAVNDRIRAAFGSAGASTGSVAGYVAGNPVAVPATTEGPAFWMQAFGSWGSTNGDGNAAHVNRSTGGFLIGADAPVLDSWRLGVVAGYSNTSFDANDRQSSGSSGNYHVGLYGGTSWGDLAFRAGAAYTWHEVMTSRGVAFPGLADSLKGSYDAHTAQAFGEVGYGVSLGPARFEPFAGVAYVRLSTQGFTEQGGAAALTSPGATTDAVFTTVGLRASATIDVGGATVTAKGTIGWRHAFGDVTPQSTMRFAAGGGAFPIRGLPIARDAAVVEAGLDVALTPNATLGVSYGGQFGSGSADHSVKATVSIKF